MTSGKPAEDPPRVMRDLCRCPAGGPRWLGPAVSLRGLACSPALASGCAGQGVTVSRPDRHRERPIAPHGAFFADDEIDLRFLDAFMAGADLMLTLGDGRTVQVKVGGLGSRKLVLIGARMQ